MFTKSIRLSEKQGSAPTSLTDGTDVTRSFSFNNGQTEMIYDLATIRPNIALGATDWLLIGLDYFYLSQQSVWAISH
jgi:hypothetical protein